MKWLLQKDHAPGLEERSRRQAVVIDAGGKIEEGGGAKVEGRAVSPGRRLPVDERGDLPSESIEDLQRYKNRLGQIEADGR